MLKHTLYFIGNNHFTFNTVSRFGDLHTKRLVLFGCTVLFLISGLFYLFPPIHDDTSYAMTGTAIASDTTLSISVDNDVLALDLSPVSQSGTFSTTTTPATVYVTTNNITGYTLGIRTSTSDNTATKLVNNIDECVDTPASTKCSLSSIDSPVSPDTYAATTSTDLNNTWGYSPSKYNSEQNEDYLPAPNTGDLDIINITTGPNETNTNNVNNNNGNNNTTSITDELVPDEYTINLGSRIDYTPYAGQYSGTLILTAVGNPVPYSVSYDANKPAQAPATANVDNVPNAQTGSVSSGDTIAVVLDTKVPTLTGGYVFAGWCSTQTTETLDAITNKASQSCPPDATLYQPGDSFGIDQTSDNTQILYAVWGAPATITFDSNGLYYNNDATDTINAVSYIPTYKDGIITGTKTNTTYTGAYAAPSPLVTPSPTNYIFKGWSTNISSTTPIYATEQEIINNLNLNANSNITLYAIWSYTTIITFDGNDSDGGTAMNPITVEAGQTIPLPQNTYIKDGYEFIDWNTADNGTGTSYADQSEYTAAAGSENIILYAQWEPPCDTNSICYRANGANEGTNANTMSNQAVSSSTEVTLWPVNYRYDTNNDGYNDYGFAGWSKDRKAAAKIADNDPDNDPIIYGPNQDITIPDVSSRGINLYAVWVAPAIDSAGNILTFQTTDLLTATLADNTTLASKPVKYVTALRDYRDNQVYAVAKLADENYWMIENLRLDNTATIGNNKNDSTITNQSLAEGYGGAFTGLADAESANFIDNTVANSLYNSDNIAGSSSNRGYRFPRYNNINTNPNTTTTNMATFDNNSNIYSLGNYYSWAAAIADTTSHTNIATSICPSGWHLPYESGDGSFFYLGAQINLSNDHTYKAWRSFPNNFIYSGDFHDASAKGRSSNGFYWSANSSDGLRADTLAIDNNINSNNSLFMQYPVYKYNGYSVRCTIK